MCPFIRHALPPASYPGVAALSRCERKACLLPPKGKKMHSQNACWRFQEKTLLETERNPTSKESFKDDALIDYIVRESIQNSLDAVDSSLDKPVRVRIFYESRGIPYQDVADCFEGLHDHLLAADAIKGGALGLAGILANPCDYLVIEDFNTTGLTGPVSFSDDQSNYYAYFMKDSGTEKGDSGKTLGSRGMGKAVFQKASRLHCSFALSRRKVETPTDPEEFLAGKCTLVYHSIDGVKHRPDGWFAVDGNTMQPETEQAVLSRFKSRFHLTRQTERGMSLVIPYLAFDNPISFDEVARSVVSNFLVAIASGKLEVEIEAEGRQRTTISKRSFGDWNDAPEGTIPYSALVKLFSMQSSEKGVIPQHLGMIQQYFRRLDSGELNPVGLAKNQDSQKSRWTSSLFWPERVEKMQSDFRAGELLVVRVPFYLDRFDGSRTQRIESNFLVLLQKPDSSTKESTRALYYRLGLWIRDADKNTYPNARALVLAEDTEAVRFLTAAEPAAHNNWTANEDRVKKDYSRISDCIKYIKSAVSEISKYVVPDDETTDENYLLDLLYIEKETEPVHPQEKPSKHRRPGGKAVPPNPTDDTSSGGESPPTPPIPPIPESVRPFEIHALPDAERNDDRYGILVKERDNAEERFPYEFTLTFHYATEEEGDGGDYDPRDFRIPFVPETFSGELTERQKRSNKENPLVFQIDEGREHLEFGQEEAHLNKLKVRVLGHPFQFTLTGFDPNLDVVWKRPKATYLQKGGENNAG